MVGNNYRRRKNAVARRIHFNFYANNQGNQTQPLLLSNKGLYVWSEEPYKFKIEENQIVLSKFKVKWYPAEMEKR